MKRLYQDTDDGGDWAWYEWWTGFVLGVLLTLGFMSVGWLLCQ